MLRRSVRTVCQAVITGKSLPPCYYSVRKVTEQRVLTQPVFSFPQLNGMNGTQGGSGELTQVIGGES